MADPRIGVIVVAAGVGSRLGAAVPKAFVALAENTNEDKAEAILDEVLAS